MQAEPQRFKELESAIDKAVESYDSGMAIDNLESAALPNKRAVIEAMGRLEHVLFIGFYSKRSLNRDNLRHGVAEHMYAAHHLLVEQIGRALKRAPEDSARKRLHCRCGNVRDFR